MKHRNNIIKLTAVILLLAIAGIVMYRSGFRVNIDLGEIRNYIKSYGSFAAVIYIAIFTIRSLLVIFPYSLAVGLGGSLFGPVKAFLYSMIAVFLSATLAFYVSRLLGKSFVQKLLRGKLKELDSKVEEHGFKVIFFMRLSALFPFDILSFAAGLTKMKYRDFILGTMLGIVAETFSLTYLGHNIDHPFSPKFMFAILLIVLTIAVPFMFARRKQKKENEKTKAENR